MSQSFQWSCACGDVQVTLDAQGLNAGTRIMCYCKDCQSSARHLGTAEQSMSEAGGTDIWQTTPRRMEIVAGPDKLAVQRLAKRGLFRWYTICCKTPFCNTSPALRVPFAGVVLHKRLQPTADVTFGRVLAQVNSKAARPNAGAPAKDYGQARMGFGVLSRMILAALRGEGKLNPLRRESGAPIAPVKILTAEERRAAAAP